MSEEIKTVDERLGGIDFSGNRVEVSTEEFAALNDEVSELRAAYEELQKENAFVINDLRIARSHIRTLKAENAALRKHIEQNSEYSSRNIKMLEHQNRLLLDQLTKADLLSPRTYVIELTNGATLLDEASKNRIVK